MKLYVVGKHLKSTDHGPVWEMNGVYDNLESALAACRDENYFVGPVVLNQPFAEPDTTIVWPGAYYPHQPKEVVL